MNELTKTAMLGTAKATGTSLGAQPQIGGAWDALALERERELLLRAGADTTMRLAGHTTSPGIELPAPAEAEEWDVCNARIANLAQTLLQGKNYSLVTEAFALLVQRKRRLPPWLLPAVLDLEDVDLRETALPLLGKRGVWLSQFQPRWRWSVVDDTTALPDDAERIWEEGSQAERIKILFLARSNDPELSRTWLNAVWKKERAEFKSNALDTFAVNLGMDDEPLLERALDDRAQSVREQAVRLLAKLPTSAFVARMRERGETMLSYTPPPSGNRLQSFVRSLTAKQTSGTLEVVVPTTLDDAWKHDNLPDHTTSYGLVPAVIRTIIGAIPPSHWEKQWGATPQDFVTAALGNKDHLVVLLSALTEAARTFDDQSWVRPLWDALTTQQSAKAYPDYQRNSPLSMLLATLDDQERARFIEEQFGRLDEDKVAVGVMMRAMPSPWSEAFATKVLDRAFRRITSRPKEYDYDDPLGWAGTSIPPQLIDRTIGNAQSLLERHDHWQLRNCLETLEIRQRIRKEID